MSADEKQAMVPGVEELRQLAQRAATPGEGLQGFADVMGRVSAARNDPERLAEVERLAQVPHPADPVDEVILLNDLEALSSYIEGYRNWVDLVFPPGVEAPREAQHFISIARARARRPKRVRWLVAAAALLAATAAVASLRWSGAFGTAGDADAFQAERKEVFSPDPLGAILRGKRGQGATGMKDASEPPATATTPPAEDVDAASPAAEANKAETIESAGGDPGLRDTEFGRESSEADRGSSKRDVQGRSKSQENARPIAGAPSLDELDRRAQEMWAGGKRKEAEAIYREIVRRGGQSRHAELAFGELFSLVKLRGRDPISDWKAYLRRFPDGRYAADAITGLCARDEAPDPSMCQP